MAARIVMGSVGLFVCVLLIGMPARAQDDPPGRVGRIAELQGEVWVFERDQGEWVPALRNRPFTQGDRLSTAAASAARLQIGSTTLYVDGNSELEALRLDDEAMQFQLERGSLALRVRSDEVAVEVSVDNAEGRFMPAVAGFYRVDRLDERSDAMVWRGELRFESPDLSVRLREDQRARFWQDGWPSTTRHIWLTPLDDAFAQAVLRADQTDSRGAATLFVPAEMTGVDDLDRLGHWQQHPDYGAVWSPIVVSVGWAPYRFGQWIWLPPWGWTWVDDAPWGFAPFHYGRWLWWGGRWCWAPGPIVRRPAFAPALVAWSDTPVRVGRGPAPVVGWVPLAPREPYRPAYRASPDHLRRLNPPVPQARERRPGDGNRGVPGAVTWLPTGGLRPRQPVANTALHSDNMKSRQWPSPTFDHQAPGRPLWPQRERIAPRPPSPTAPTGALATAPAAPPQRPPGVARPDQDSAPAAGPFFGRPPRVQAPGTAPERVAAPGLSPPAPATTTPTNPTAAAAPPKAGDAPVIVPAPAHPVPSGPRHDGSPRRPVGPAHGDGRPTTTPTPAAPQRTAPGRAAPVPPGAVAGTPTAPGAPTAAPAAQQPFKPSPTPAPSRPSVAAPVPATAAPTAAAPPARGDSRDAAGTRQSGERDERRGTPNSRRKAFE